jgi:hypothetical protein
VADCDQGSWNPDLFEFLGFRVRLHLPGMTPEGCSVHFYFDLFRLGLFSLRNPYL